MQGVEQPAAEGVKRTQIGGMSSSTPRLALRQGSPGCSKNGRILLANPLQSSKRTFSWGSFLSFFGFKGGMVSTPISARGGSPTVSGRLLRAPSQLPQHRFIPEMSRAG